MFDFFAKKMRSSRLTDLKEGKMTLSPVKAKPDPGSRRPGPVLIRWLYAVDCDHLFKNFHNFQEIRQPAIRLPLCPAKKWSRLRPRHPDEQSS